MSKKALLNLLGLVCEYAYANIQTSYEIRAYADELQRLAACLKTGRRYKPDLKALGWP